MKCDFCEQENKVEKFVVSYICDSCIRTYFSNIYNKVKKMKKAQLQDLYADACFRSNIENTNMDKIKAVMEVCQICLGPHECFRIRRESENIKLRNRYIEARLNNDPLPRISPIIRRHIEKELSKTYKQFYNGSDEPIVIPKPVCETDESPEE